MGNVINADENGLCYTHHIVNFNGGEEGATTWFLVSTDESICANLQKEPIYEILDEVARVGYIVSCLKCKAGHHVLRRANGQFYAPCQCIIAGG
jgi:hypothetical protein